MIWEFVLVKWVNAAKEWWTHYCSNNNLNKNNRKVKWTCKVALVV